MVHIKPIVSEASPHRGVRWKTLHYCAWLTNVPLMHSLYVCSHVNGEPVINITDLHKVEMVAIVKKKKKRKTVVDSKMEESELDAQGSKKV